MIRWLSSSLSVKRTMQACKSRIKKLSWSVASESREGLTFKVTHIPKGEGKPPDWTCGCENFKYRGGLSECKHIRMIKDYRRSTATWWCGWSSGVGPEQQTMAQEQRHICPRCSRATYIVLPSPSVKPKKPLPKKSVLAALKPTKPKWTWTKE